MPSLSTAKRVYRIVNWASLAVLIVAIVLVLDKSPAPDVPYDRNAAQRVEQRLSAAAAGQVSQVQMDRTELNSYLAQNVQIEGAAPTTGAGVVPAGPLPAGAASGGNPTDLAANNPMDAATRSDPRTIEQVESAVKDVKVDLDGDLLKAYVVFNFHGADLSLELEGHLGTENGYIRFEPVAGKLGSLPLPKSTLDSAVAKLMSSPENREKLKLPEDINDIQIANGKAVVSYK